MTGFVVSGVCRTSGRGLLAARGRSQGRLELVIEPASGEMGRIQLPVASAGEFVVKFCFPLDVVLSGFDQGLVEIRRD